GVLSEYGPVKIYWHFADIARQHGKGPARKIENPSASVVRDGKPGALGKWNHTYRDSVLRDAVGKFCSTSMREMKMTPVRYWKFLPKIARITDFESAFTQSFY